MLPVSFSAVPYPFEGTSIERYRWVQAFTRQNTDHNNVTLNWLDEDIATNYVAIDFDLFKEIWQEDDVYFVATGPPARCNTIPEFLVELQKTTTRAIESSNAVLYRLRTLERRVDEGLYDPIGDFVKEMSRRLRMAWLALKGN